MLMIRASRSGVAATKPRPWRPEAIVVARPSDRTKGEVVIGGLRIPCALGRSGPKTTKREGDGATPRTLLGPVAILLRPGPFRPRTRLPVRLIRKDDARCDDPASFRYNKPVKLPFAAGHERMWRDDALYDVVIDTDWNLVPALRGRGSAIFIHIAREGFRPTEGCIAFTPKGMRSFLSRIDRIRGLRVL